MFMKFLRVEISYWLFLLAIRTYFIFHIFVYLIIYKDRKDIWN
nr:MAG TPA: hypothetical protein [Crassvirales sp.]